jgi:diguanylate cyclase (GGDEF)-like protein
MVKNTRFPKYNIDDAENLEYFLDLTTQKGTSEHLNVDSSKETLLLGEIALLEDVLALKGKPVKVSFSEGSEVHSSKDAKIESINAALMSAYTSLGFDEYDNQIQISGTELSLKLDIPLADLTPEQRAFLNSQATRISGHLVNLDNSTFDGLTGIYNRRAFETILGHEMNELERATRNNLDLLKENDYSILMIDLDNFKKLNDIHGHTKGDNLLEKVGLALKSSLRKSDVPARYGGEEFVVLLPNTNSDGAQLVADKLLDSIRSISLKVGDEIPNYDPTASIGVYSMSQDVTEADDFRKHISEALNKADKALYAAKNSGKNKFVVYE